MFILAIKLQEPSWMPYPNVSTSVPEIEKSVTGATITDTIVINPVINNRTGAKGRPNIIDMSALPGSYNFTPPKGPMDGR